MNFEILEDADAVARAAAAAIAAESHAAIAARGTFALAVSGGHTPWIMLRELARLPVRWNAVHLFQVDERVAPEGHPDRNLTHLRESFLQYVRIPADQVHAMAVESPDLEAAAARYAQALPPALDLVHLGLGPDGHTASLVPGDPVLDVKDRDTAITGPYQGRRRMTLTYPVLDRAGKILWVVTGDEKKEMLRRLLEGDPTIPAGRVSREAGFVLADRAAAS